MSKAITLFVFCLFFFIPEQIFAQDCETTLNIQLYNIRGGVYAGQEVKLVSEGDGDVFAIKSNSKGVASFKLPCNEKFSMSISNNTQEYEIMSYPSNGGTMNQSLSYEPNMAELDEAFAMNPTEIAQVDQEASNLADTIVVRNSHMSQPLKSYLYSHVTISLKDFDGNPLVDEKVVISGQKRNKHIKTRTDRYGVIEVYLAKGETYTLNFKYHQDYFEEEISYKKGTENITLKFSYIGTKEYERRKVEEARRIKEEEERLERDRELFALEAKRAEMSDREYYKSRLELNEVGGYDTVVTAVLNRNEWLGKLIVCDITGSMTPYMAQVYKWYKKAIRKEDNLQFVFFNDGDHKSRSEKVIGETGGIYYTGECDIDSLAGFMGFVSSRGGGGDCPENNMEALIKGVKMAQPYKELVMIVDNNAPVKDIELLKDFDLPVHIVLCGSEDGFVHEDYLQIAWETKGSIHTIDEDITKIGKMTEGQQLKIKGVAYKIMKGEFIRITNK